MQVDILFVTEVIERPQKWPLSVDAEIGALIEFYGLVRETEGTQKITALSYEAYRSMAEKVMREKITALEKKHPCQAIRIVHRLGLVPKGESAIYVGIQSRHRQEGFLLLQEFMDEFKKDVPIWKSTP